MGSSNIGSGMYLQLGVKRGSRSDDAQTVLIFSSSTTIQGAWTYMDSSRKKTSPIPLSEVEEWNERKRKELEHDKKQP